MVAFQQILVPTDFSDSAASAARYACDVAHRFDSKLHFLHVLPEPTSWIPEFGMGLDFSEYVQQLPAHRERMELEALNRLSKVCEAEALPRARVTLATTFGPAHIEIVKYAKTHHCDLIVMGTHGRTGLPHVLLGSVAEQVVRMAPCPVLTVRAAGQPFAMP